MPTVESLQRQLADMQKQLAGLGVGEPAKTVVHRSLVDAKTGIKVPADHEDPYGYVRSKTWPGHEPHFVGSDTEFVGSDTEEV